MANASLESRVQGRDPTEGAVPLRVDHDEQSNPPVTPGPILTVSPEEISRFFVSVQRDQDTERWNVRLDAALREILERANDFVPSASGGILLDDPRSKLAGVRTPRLTFIAVYGPLAGRLLGTRLPSDRGLLGEIYRTGRSARADHVDADDPLVAAGSGSGAGRALESVIGVPVTVGESICGVLQLMNRRSGGPYSARDDQLLRIFAAHMSSSIQSALDAIRAQALARLDHLTGLCNSRYFHARLQDEIARADMEGGELSLLFVDLDHFKRINDQYGHLAGSWSLREVARLLAANVPPATVLARYGGDEFVAILPGSSLARALQTAEHLRSVIAAATLFDYEAETEAARQLPTVSTSIGVASYREHLALSGNQRRRENMLLRLADAAMYRAKTNGRNRVEPAEAED